METFSAIHWEAGTAKNGEVQKSANRTFFSRSNAPNYVMNSHIERVTTEEQTVI